MTCRLSRCCDFDFDFSAAYPAEHITFRSHLVNDYLVEHGIDQARLTTEGYGQTCPVADNKTKEGKAKNRRTEIEVVGTRNK